MSECNDYRDAEPGHYMLGIGLPPVWKRSGG
jgi:hypothetical protein